MDFTTSAIVKNPYFIYSELNENEKERLRELAGIGLSVLHEAPETRMDLYARLERKFRFHFGNNKPRSPLANHLVQAMKKASLEEYFLALKQSQMKEEKLEPKSVEDWSVMEVPIIEDRLDRRNKGL